MAYKVFVSSSLKDLDLARDLARRLKEVKVQVTCLEFDGSTYEERFLDLIGEADEMIVIFSSNSLARGSFDNYWMWFEIGAASSSRKKITLVLVGLEKKELPPVVEQLKYIRYDKLSEYISKIQRSAEAA